MLSRNLAIKSILNNVWCVYRLGITKNNELFVLYRNTFPTNFIRSSRSNDGETWIIEDILGSDYLNPSVFVDNNTVHVSACKNNQSDSPKHIQKTTLWENITSFSDSVDSRDLCQVLVSNYGGCDLFVSSAPGSLYTSNNYGSSWVEHNPYTSDKEWRGIDSDDDCSHLIAGGYNWRLYTSNNHGSTWTERQPAGNVNKNWQAICSSGDGAYLVAGSYLGRLYTSSDFGVTWTERQPKGNTDGHWYTASSSSDGSRIIVGEADVGRVYTSNDYGVTWTERQPAGDVDIDWRCVYSSPCGLHLIAVAVAGRVYTSNDYGATWSEKRPVGDVNLNWVSAACSADGSHLIVGGVGTGQGRLYTSYDYGETWTERQPAGDVDKGWYSCASDYNGSHLIAGAYVGNKLYTSSDFGVTWTERQPTTTDKSWRSCSSSSRDKYIIFKTEDGSKIGCIKWIQSSWGNRINIEPETGWKFVSFSCCSCEDGLFYVTWLIKNISDPTQNKIQACTFNPSDDAWGSVSTISTFCVSESGVNFPRIRQLSNDEIWVIWSKYDEYNYFQVHSSKYLGNNTWESSQQVTNCSSHNTYYDIIKSGDDIILVYSKFGASLSNPNVYNLVYKTKLETSWSDEILLTDQDTDQISPELVFKDGDIYCSYWSFDTTSSMYDVYVGKFQQSCLGNIELDFNLSSNYYFENYTGSSEPTNISFGVSLSSDYSFSKNVSIGFHSDLDAKISIRIFKT